MWFAKISHNFFGSWTLKFLPREAWDETWALEVVSIRRSHSLTTFWELGGLFLDFPLSLDEKFPADITNTSAQEFWESSCFTLIYVTSSDYFVSPLLHTFSWGVVKFLRRWCGFSVLPHFSCRIVFILFSSCFEAGNFSVEIKLTTNASAAGLIRNLDESICKINFINFPRRFIHKQAKIKKKKQEANDGRMSRHSCRAEAKWKSEIRKMFEKYWHFSRRPPTHIPGIYIVGPRSIACVIM